MMAVAVVACNHCFVLDKVYKSLFIYYEACQKSPSVNTFAFDVSRNNAAEPKMSLAYKEITASVM